MRDKLATCRDCGVALAPCAAHHARCDCAPHPNECDVNLDDILGRARNFDANAGVAGEIPGLLVEAGRRAETVLEAA